MSENIHVLSVESHHIDLAGGARTSRVSLHPEYTSTSGLLEPYPGMVEQEQVAEEDSDVILGEGGTRGSASILKDDKTRLEASRRAKERGHSASGVGAGMMKKDADDKDKAEEVQTEEHSQLSVKTRSAIPLAVAEAMPECMSSETCQQSAELGSQGPGKGNKNGDASLSYCILGVIIVSSFVFGGLCVWACHSLCLSVASE